MYTGIINEIEAREILGGLLEGIRVRHHLTVEDLVRRTRLSRRVIIRIENGIPGPKRREIILLIKALESQKGEKDQLYYLLEMCLPKQRQDFKISAGMVIKFHHPYRRAVMRQ